MLTLLCLFLLFTGDIVFWVAMAAWAGWVNLPFGPTLGVSLFSLLGAFILLFVAEPAPEEDAYSLYEEGIEECPKTSTTEVVAVVAVDAVVA